MTYVSRDPFARQELHRSHWSDKELAASASCDWCGHRNAKGGLYTYRIESDGGRVSEIQGKFCGITCMRAYNG